MKCFEVYKHALSLISESPESGLNDDYKERAQYLLASWCTELAGMDSEFRISSGKPQGLPFSNVIIELEYDFPLCERFAPAAAYFLASMLVAEENPDFSDKLYARYTDAISSLAQEIPASVEPIMDRYGFSDY